MKLNSSLFEIGYASLSRILISLIQLFSSLYVAQMNSAQEYGYYVLIISIFYFVDLILNPFLTGPGLVLGASLGKEEFEKYFNFLFWGQLVTAVVLSIITQAVFVTFNILVFNIEISDPIFLTIIPLRMQDFFFRIFIIRLETKRAFINNLIFFSVQLFLLSISYFRVLPISNTFATIFYILALSSSISSISGIYRFNKLLKVKIHNVVSHILKNWEFGKWQFVSAISYFGYSKAYIFILYYVLGPNAVASINVVETILRPVKLFLESISSYLISKSAVIVNKKGLNYLISKLKNKLVLAILILTVSLILMNLSGELLINILFGSKYVNADISFILLIFSIGVIAFYLRTLLMVFFYAINLPKYYSISLFITLMISVPCLYLFIHYFAITGVALSLLSSEILLVWVMVHIYHSRIKKETVSEMVL